MTANRSKLKFTAFAENDLSETWEYVAESAPDQADRLIDELHKVSLLIAQNPLIGTLRDNLRPGIRIFPHHQHNIYYFISEPGIEVYRILHSSRDAVQIFENHTDQPN